MPGPSGWSQIHDFKPDDPVKMTARGKLFVAIATKRGENLGGIDTISAGRELIARIHEEYYGDLTLKPFNSLKNAVDKVVKEYIETWGEVEVAACSYVDGIVYSAAFGGAEVTISRGGILGTILKSTTQGVVSASGFPKEGDVILLATGLFHEKIPQGVIKAALTAETPEETVESFGPEVRIGGIGSLACVVIKFEEKAALPIFAVNPNQSSLSNTITEAGESPKAKFNLPDFSRKFSALIDKFGQKIPGRDIYVKPQPEDETSSQSKKMTFSVAIILLVLLGVSVAFGARQKRSNDLKSKYQTVLSAAKSEVDEAIALASISPEKSRELFIDSEQKLAQIDAMKVKDPEIDKLREKIEESRGAILGEYKDNPQLFFDLSLLSTGFLGDSVSVSGKKVYVMDKNGKRVVSVELETKKSGVVSGPTIIDEANDLASYEDRAFVLMNDGVYEVSTTKTKVIDKTWSGQALIRGFAGNLYVLDKEGNAIYRYAGQGKSFGSQQNWLAASTRADFSQVKQWVIDGSVYALLPGSKVLKYSLGSPQAFSLRGVAPEIGNVDAIFASEDNEGVYFLDKAGSRVVVTDKKGSYLAQYVAEGISSASKIVATEKDKKLIFLTTDKLFSLELKHI